MRSSVLAPEKDSTSKTMHIDWTHHCIHLVSTCALFTCSHVGSLSCAYCNVHFHISCCDWGWLAVIKLHFKKVMQICQLQSYSNVVSARALGLGAMASLTASMQWCFQGRILRHSQLCFLHQSTNWFRWSWSVGHCLLPKGIQSHHWRREHHVVVGFAGSLLRSVDHQHPSSVQIPNLLSCLSSLD